MKQPDLQNWASYGITKLLRLTGYGSYGVAVACDQGTGSTLAGPPDSACPLKRDLDVYVFGAQSRI